MKLYVVDAFTKKIFRGNPAAVCVLDGWLDDGLMQSMAMEQNLSETAFVHPLEDGRWAIRWFTPGGEIDFCGHATLASSHVLFSYVQPEAQTVCFASKCKGDLPVARRDDLYEMDFPASRLQPVPVTERIAASLGGAVPDECWLDGDLLCVFKDPASIAGIRPDLEAMRRLEARLVHVTARDVPGGQADCQTRSFGPKFNIPEDPVCGAAHCLVAPYWGRRLDRKELACRQASARGGMLFCSLRGDRVSIAGHAVTYAVSEVLL